jgi:hypothetical protein
MAKVANNNHIPIVLFVHPILYNIGNYPFEDIHQQVIRLADEHGYITEDLLPAFEGYDGRELWVHGSDPHPNEIAHKLSGEYAAKKLIEHIACKEQ